MKKILVTGASGFIGSFIVEEALRRGLKLEDDPASPRLIITKWGVGYYLAE